MAVDPTTVKSTVKSIETSNKKIDPPNAAWPKQKSPKKDLPKKDLPKAGSSETVAPEKLPSKLPSTEGLVRSKRGRRRHRRRVFKPKRRGRPRHMLPGGSR